MNSKQKIAKVLLIIGFAISIANYGLELVSFYANDDFALVIEEMEENSEPSEKEGSEKEDIKETDKISQFYNNGIFEVSNIYIHAYPEKKFSGTLIYLEYSTPPPEVI